MLLASLAVSAFCGTFCGRERALSTSNFAMVQWKLTTS